MALVDSCGWSFLTVLDEGHRGTVFSTTVDTGVVPHTAHTHTTPTYPRTRAPHLPTGPAVYHAMPACPYLPAHCGPSHTAAAPRTVTCRREPLLATTPLPPRPFARASLRWEVPEHALILSSSSMWVLVCFPSQDGGQETLLFLPCYLLPSPLLPPYL